MTADDLFPDDGEGDDHPIMALFVDMDTQVDDFFSMVLRMCEQRGVPVVDSPPSQSDSLDNHHERKTQA